MVGGPGHWMKGKTMDNLDNLDNLYTRTSEVKWEPYGCSAGCDTCGKLTGRYVIATYPTIGGRLGRVRIHECEECAACK